MQALDYEALQNMENSGGNSRAVRVIQARDSKVLHGRIDFARRFYGGICVSRGICLNGVHRRVKFSHASYLEKDATNKGHLDPGDLERSGLKKWSATERDCKGRDLEGEDFKGGREDDAKENSLAWS